MKKKNKPTMYRKSNEIQNVRRKRIYNIYVYTHVMRSCHTEIVDFNKTRTNSVANTKTPVPTICSLSHRSNPKRDERHWKHEKWKSQNNFFYNFFFFFVHLLFGIIPKSSSFSPFPISSKNIYTHACIPSILLYMNLNLSWVVLFWSLSTF